MASPTFPDRIAVVGVGLIGGSVALAAKARGATVVGIGRDEVKLEAARKAGVVDEFATGPEGAAWCELVVVCTPVDRVVDDLVAVEEHVEETAVLTDAGSTKVAICDGAAARLKRPGQFVAAHPLAGSEKAGWQNARADLLHGKVCVLTRTSANDIDSLRRAAAFWGGLGMVGLDFSPSRHDELLAQSSHLPHLVAAALVRCLERDARPLTATGYADTTRIAAGDAALWAAIVESNAGPVCDALGRMETELRGMRESVERRDFSGLQTLLAEAARRRSAE